MGKFAATSAAFVGLALAACSTTGGAETRWTGTSFASPIVVHSGLSEDISGGLELVDRYIEAYRKAGAKNANARQYFDVPAMLAAVGGATAVALGANADVAIGTGAFSALAASGKGYYTPNERADAYYDAVTALSCIQQEAIGLDVQFTEPKQIVKAANNMAEQNKDGLTMTDYDWLEEANNLIVDDEKRAFLLLKNATLNVENVLRSRLANKGSLADASSIAALVIMYQSEIEASKEKREKGEEGEDESTQQSALFKKEGIHFGYQPKLEDLAPKLNICALMAQE